jgi:DNA replication protein DnaC
MSNTSAMLLEHHLKELKLPTFLSEYGRVARQCAAESVDHADYLLRLSELELIDRHHRMVDRRIKAARFPTTKSLDTFDFLAIPSLNKALVLELARCEYIDRKENLIAAAPARPTSLSVSAWPRVRGACPWASPPPPPLSTS